MILIPAKLFRPKHHGDFWAIQGIGLLAVTLACAMANDYLCSAHDCVHRVLLLGKPCAFLLVPRTSIGRSGRAGAVYDVERSWQLVRTNMRWWLLIVGIALFAFFLTPRPTERKAAIFLHVRTKMEIGISEGSVDLNRTGSLEQNNEIAFKVYADDAAGKPEAGP